MVYPFQPNQPMCTSPVFLCIAHCSPCALLQGVDLLYIPAGCAFFMHLCRVCLFVQFCCALLQGVHFFLHFFCRMCNFLLTSFTGCAFLCTCAFLQGVHFCAVMQSVLVSAFLLQDVQLCCALLQGVHFFAFLLLGVHFFVHFCHRVCFLCTSAFLQGVHFSCTSAAGCAFVHFFCRTCNFVVHFYCRVCFFCALLQQVVHFRQFLALQSWSPRGRYQR